MPKFWIVMPADHLWGAEGVPEGMPHRKDCRVFYHEADAEEYLLLAQQGLLGRHDNMVILEAKATAEPMDWAGAFKVVELHA